MLCCFGLALYQYLLYLLGAILGTRVRFQGQGQIK